MKNMPYSVRLVGLAMLLLMTLLSCRQQPSHSQDDYSEEARRLLPSAGLTDSVSYLLGVNFAVMLHYGGGGSDGEDFGDIDFQRVKEGIDDFLEADTEGRYPIFLKDGFAGEEYESFRQHFDVDPALTEQLFNTYLSARLDARGKINTEKSEAFFAENKEQEGVKEISVKYPTASGDSLKTTMQYRIVTPGEGPEIALGDSLLLSWRGRILDGREFDVVDSLKISSFADSLFVFGFSAGLKKLHVGDVATFYIPSELGFGDGRSPEGRPFFSPYAALVFDVTVHAPQPEPEEETEKETEAEEADNNLSDN